MALKTISQNPPGILSQRYIDSRVKASCVSNIDTLSEFSAGSISKEYYPKSNYLPHDEPTTECQATISTPISEKMIVPKSMNHHKAEKLLKKTQKNWLAIQQHLKSPSVPEANTTVTTLPSHVTKPLKKK
jgi:hypothetical protein